MFFRNQYGVDLGEAGYAEKFKGPPFQPAETKTNALYVAEIVGWREGKADFDLPIRVMDADGHPLINPNWQIAVWHASAPKEGRPNKTFRKARPIAWTYPLEEAFTGISFRSEDAYVNDDGGPLEVWLDGPDIESPVWQAGWFGAGHVFTGPYLVVRSKAGSQVPTNPVPPVVPGSPSGQQMADTLINVANWARTK